MGWSFLTMSPSATDHLARMPELMDSPIGGILTSRRGMEGRSMGCSGEPAAGPRAERSLESEGVLKEFGEFHPMQGQVADGRRRGGAAAGVQGLSAEDRLELRGDPGPRPHVLGLL